jgi:hypothetical protein
MTSQAGIVKIGTVRLGNPVGERGNLLACCGKSVQADQRKLSAALVGVRPDNGLFGPRALGRLLRCRDGAGRGRGPLRRPRHGGGLTVEHLKGELRATRPLSILIAEKVRHLRAWAAERTVPA